MICLGGSAGGLDAYLRILRSLPPTPRLAIVIAAHRAADFADLLPSLLASATQMLVVEARSGMRLEPCRVYIIPPRTELSLSADEFRTNRQQPPRGWPKTINLFLFSLAKEIGANAVAVIVSGMDSDGSAALKAIKSAGGTTFAQSDAQISQMPDSAVETGYVDFLLPAAEIGPALITLLERA